MHDLPRNAYDSIRRVDDPGQYYGQFELYTTDVETTVTVDSSEDVIVLDTRLSFSIDAVVDQPDGLDKFRLCQSMFATAPGFTVTGTLDRLGAEETATISLEHRLYGEGQTKHRLLTDLTAMIDAATNANALLGGLVD